MAVKINHIHSVESTVALDVTWAHKVHLMDVVAAQGLGKVRVLDTLGGIACFFLRALPASGFG